MNRTLILGLLLSLLAVAVLTLLSFSIEGARTTYPHPAPPVIGEEPAIQQHISQAEIEAGRFTLEELLEHGRTIFTAGFNSLDGAGRPELTGTGEPRKRRTAPDNFNRISAPDANSCRGRHNLPAAGGGGDNVSNVFVLAQENLFVDFDGDPVENGSNRTLKTVGNERNTVSIFGASFIELLAREMTAELQAQRASACDQAMRAGWVVTASLAAKRVDFGALTCHPDGSADTSHVEGVDADLVIRPFHQKGVVVSLREFSNNALLHHHGILAAERADGKADPDADGYANELTVGDITALTLFQATLPAPVRVAPNTRAEREAAARGRLNFDQIRCSDCHIPAMPLASLEIVEPGPFNPANNLRPEDVGATYKVDLSPFIADLKQDGEGNFLLPVYTDLKRHDMGEFLNNEALEQAGVPTRCWLTRKLWGIASEPPYLHHGRATLISEAILAHGGEAQEQRYAFAELEQREQAELLKFLLTLRIAAGEN
ncbi:MAG: hypothetical protein OXI52_09315 [Caldilineaceae bacterium]|nr:hypothetical protein [Caldilineaceae bacterium]